MTDFTLLTVVVLTAIVLVAAALLVCVVAAVCFLTDPPASRRFPMGGNGVSDLEPRQIVEQIKRIERLDGGGEPYVNAEQFDLLLTSDFQWDGSGAVRFFYFRDQATYSAQLRLFTEERQYFVTEAQEWPEQSRIFRLQDYLDALKYMPQAEIRQLSPDADGYSVVLMESGTPGDWARSITYDAGGVGTLDGWYIHLAVLPLHEDRSSSGDETNHLFYGGEEGSTGPAVTRWVDYTQAPDEMDWDGELTAQLPQFPGVSFRYAPDHFTAVGGDGA